MTGDAVTIMGTNSGTAASYSGFAVSNGAGRFQIATSFANARANTLPSSLPMPSGFVMTSLSRTSTPRFTINGVFDTQDTPKTNIGKLLLNQAAQMSYSNGKFRLIGAAEGYKVEVNEPGYRDVITDDDIIAPIDITPTASKRDRFNSVKGVYVDPGQGYQPVSFPTRSIAALQRGNDGLVETEIALEYVTNEGTASWIAENYLLDAQQATTVSITVGLEGLRYEVGDHILLDIARYTYIRKHFRVINFGLAPVRAKGGGGGLAVELTLREWNNNVANINDATLAVPITAARIPRTNLPTVYYSPAPTGLTLASGNDHLTVGTAGNIDVNIMLTWMPPGASTFVSQYEVRYKKRSETTYGTAQVVPGGDNARSLIGPLEDGIRYDVQIRSVNALGVKSRWIGADHVVVGKTAPPPTVIGLSGRTLHEGTREFNVDTSNWPADVRVGGGVEIRILRFLSVNAGDQPVWSATEPISENPINTFPFTTTLISAGEYWLAARMVDSSGNYSTVTAYRKILLGNQAQGTVVLDRDEAIPAIDWNGTLAPGTLKVADPNGSVLVAAKPTGGDDFTDLPNFLGSVNTVINDIVFHNAPVIYTTQIVDLNNTLVFAPFVNVEYRGDLHSIQIIHGPRATPAGIQSATTTTLENDEQGDPITDRYVQFRVEVRANAATQTNAMLTGMEMRLSGDTVEHKYTNLNTTTSTPPVGFRREVVNGNIRLEFAHTGQVANIETVELTGFQRPPGDTGTWGVIPVIISKGALFRGGLPIAQIELRRVDFTPDDGDPSTPNLNGTTTDGVIDIRLTGPRTATRN